MIVYYKRYDRKPSGGDLKVMANGDMFIRGQSYARRNGQIIGAIANGNTWYKFINEDDSFEPREVSNARKEYMEKGLKIFATNTKRKKERFRHIRLDMRLKSDREKYIEIFKCKEISDSIDVVALTVKV